jgi:hypothetical protein
MKSTLIRAMALVGSLTLTALPALSAAPAQSVAAPPRVLDVSSVGVDNDAQLSSLIADVRRQADAFVFLSGGASWTGIISASCWRCSRPWL